MFELIRDICEQMSKELKEKAESQSDNLEKKLAEKRALMKEGLLAMEQMLVLNFLTDLGKSAAATFWPAFWLQFGHILLQFGHIKGIF